MSYGIPKPKNCVGKKGRSGRKSVGEEIAKREAIIKAWNTVNNNADNITVALPIALKTMTDKKEVSGNLTISFDESFNLTQPTKEDNPEQI